MWSTAADSCSRMFFCGESGTRQQTQRMERGEMPAYVFANIRVDDPIAYERLHADSAGHHREVRRSLPGSGRAGGGARGRHRAGPHHHPRVPDLRGRPALVFLRGILRRQRQCGRAAPAGNWSSSTGCERPGACGRACGGAPRVRGAAPTATIQSERASANSPDHGSSSSETVPVHPVAEFFITSRSTRSGHWRPPAEGPG